MNLVDVAASVDAVEVEAEDAEEVTVVDVEVRLTHLCHYENPNK